MTISPTPRRVRGVLTLALLIGAAGALPACASDSARDQAQARQQAETAALRDHLASAQTDARQQEAAYLRLKAKRDALGGGNDSVTTLASLVGPGGNATPQAVTENAPPPQDQTAAEPPAAPAAAAPTTVASAAPEAPAAETPPAAPPPEEASSGAAPPAPPQGPPQGPPQPPPNQPSPAQMQKIMRHSGRPGDQIAKIDASCFSGNRLNAHGHQVLSALLPVLVEHPHHRILVSSVKVPRIHAVHQALVGMGVPTWRVQDAGGRYYEVRLVWGSPVDTH
jgi:hypothetical protein